MAREVKVLKDKDGNDVEVYSTLCNVCSTEMVFPKVQADMLESLLPFLKDKVDMGSPCIDCAKKQLEEGTFNLYTQEEIEMIKNLASKKE